ncbi:PQ-loop repeat-containing protein [Facilibium subflavum]|uniref:PQ-loop repeat-containing protein n=1 Tax=Facilibium subflavum TaxID=2219058 RepID=UPI0013C36A3B|nr:PQ-loop repeat-containing protein [Facilibium subflavum]
MKPLSSNTLEKIGMFSMLSYSMQIIPQIAKNYRQKSADGLSIVFILLSIIALCCDETAALCLNYPLPSKTTPIVVITLLFFVICQRFYYHILSKAIALRIA